MLGVHLKGVAFSDKSARQCKEQSWSLNCIDGQMSVTYDPFAHRLLLTIFAHERTLQTSANKISNDEQEDKGTRNSCSN